VRVAATTGLGQKTPAGHVAFLDIDQLYFELIRRALKEFTAKVLASHFHRMMLNRISLFLNWARNPRHAAFSGAKPPPPE
jgi:hypothetical protein